MFNNVCTYRPSQDASSDTPNNQDLKQILDMLNSGKFYMRIYPELYMKPVIEKLQFETGRFPICHTVARRVVDHFPDMKKESGYLIRTSMDIDSWEKYVCKLKEHEYIRQCMYPEFAFNSTTKQFDIILQHHSVVIDNQGNYIECLPVELDHIHKYLFIPHQSGALGYDLFAN
jgi:hypothetical protein